MESPPLRRRNWVKWALAVSLGLNLIVIGLVAGVLVKGPPRPWVEAPGLWFYAQALPEPYRSDLGKTLRTSRHEWREARDALRSRRQALAAALVRDPFNAGEVERVLAGQDGLADELAERGRRLLMDQIGRMDAADRVAFSEALAKGPESRRSRRARP